MPFKCICGCGKSGKRRLPSSETQRRKWLKILTTSPLRTYAQKNHLKFRIAPHHFDLQPGSGTTPTLENDQSKMKRAHAFDRARRNYISDRLPPGSPQKAARRLYQTADELVNKNLELGLLLKNEKKNAGAQIRMLRKKYKKLLEEHNRLSAVHSEQAKQLLLLSQDVRTVLDDQDFLDGDAKEVKRRTSFSPHALVAFYKFLPAAGFKKKRYWRGPSWFEVQEANPNDRGTGGRSRKLSLFCELCFTLYVLCTGCHIDECCALFGISKATGSSVFSTVIMFLYHLLQEEFPWPSKAKIVETMPDRFTIVLGESAKRLSVIIDCFPVHIQKPDNPQAQRTTYSQYYAGNVAKFLIGIAPNGYVSFISDAYPGAASDNQIVEHSGFLDHISHGDDVMADKGFLVRDLLAAKGSGLIMPPVKPAARGKKGSRAMADRSQYGANEDIATKRIASLRIHVERAIGRMHSKFKILDNTFPTSMKDLIGPLVAVCAYLCNYNHPLVKN